MLGLAALALAAPTAMASPAAAPDRQPNIVGGTPVADGTYPFMVLLRVQVDGRGELPVCGASLIDPFRVLTAAHCVHNFTPEELPALSATVGSTNISGAGGTKHHVIGLDVHPKFDFPQNDVAVLYLKEPAYNVETVLLPTAGTDALERPGSLATVLGWGNTIEQSPGSPDTGNSSFPDRLREVQVPIVSRTECRTAYPDTVINDTILCAGVTGKDSCQGDSGGPLIKPTTLDNGRRAWIQIGVVSGGDGCAATGAPGYYARLGNAEINAFVR